MRTHLLATVAAVALLAALPAHAQDATWLLNPGSGNFNTAANWTPAAIPTGTAFFGPSNQTSVTVSNSFDTLDRIVINAGAPAYTFTITNGGVTLNGVGIVNNSSFFPTFNISSGSSLTAALD